MRQTKAQKKFEKHHLKDTLERRKGLKKVKQKQQLKARKKSRRAEENGGNGEQEDKANGSAAKTSDAFNAMSVDEFFQGGFDIPTPDLPKKKKGKTVGGKRKREEVEEDEDGDEVEHSGPEEEAVLQGGSDAASDGEGSDDDEGFEEQLDALAVNDPEFHKYLQDTEPQLLKPHMEGAFDDLSDEEQGPKRKKAKKTAADSDSQLEEDIEGGGKNELTKPTIEKWRTALTTHHSLRATKEVVLAFRSAAHVSEETEDQTYKYSISNPEVYHQLLTLALTQIPEVFQHHLPVHSNPKTGKAHIDTSSKKFKTLAPLLRSQINSISHLLDHLSDASTLRLTLSSTLPLLPYLLSFKKLIRALAKAVVPIWSSSAQDETVRISAFLILRRLVVLGDAGIQEAVLKSAYQGLVQGSRNTTVHTLGGVNLMKNSAAELWGLVEKSVAYTTAFTFIRQLAIHLRHAIRENKNEGYKTVYNWQYTHSLDFWSRVLSSHCTSTDSGLRPLIYPLVQVSLGALRLIPTATYFPLRFHLIRSLLRISRATGTYIPLAAALYEVLNSAEMRKAPKPSTLKPLDFATAVRAPKAYLRTRVYQDGVGEQVQELFAEFFGLWCTSIGFPELALPVTVVLRRWLKGVNDRTPGKGNKNQKVNSMVRLLVEKLEANARFVEGRREKVDFAPDRRQQVEKFAGEVGWEGTPVGAWVVGMRKMREVRERAEREAREGEEKRVGRKEVGRKNGRVGGEESEEVDGDEE